MSIKIIVNKITFPTECEVSSFVSLKQNNYCGKNYIVLKIEDIKEILKTHEKYMEGFKQ